VMALTKNFAVDTTTEEWCGFSQNDQRHRL